MILSILISLTPTQSSPVLGPLSRPIQAWFLTQLTRFQPAIASRLHDQNCVKPYTVSTLLNEKGRALSSGRWLEPGENLWIRLTSFDNELSQVIIKELLPKLPNRIELYKMVFRINGFTFDPAQSPWASTTSFPELAEKIWMDGNSRLVRLEFNSPTAFRSEGADIPLPIPSHVFRGVWQKWNSFAPEVLHIDAIWPEFTAACVMVSEITSLNTERWQFAEGIRGTSTGFTGTVAFILLPRHMCKGYEEQWDGANHILRLLSAFAFYCGIGHHATIGMGQTRMLTTPDRQ
jgi:CRISPR-associated endoribonuclease Cas6